MWWRQRIDRRVQRDRNRTPPVDSKAFDSPMRVLQTGMAWTTNYTYVLNIGAWERARCWIDWQLRPVPALSSPKDGFAADREERRATTACRDV